jgi:microcystin-dependent protein
MSQPFVGEVRLVGFNFNPTGWHLCDGSLLPISGYEVLFTLLGTTYGGDGQTTFGLPDLRGRVPIHQGTGLGLSPYVIGQQGGVTSVTVNTSQLPEHTHPVSANSGPGTANSAVNNYFAQTPTVTPMATTGAAVSMASPVGSIGANQPHENRQPFLTVNYIIALYGIYPSRS